MERSSKLTLGMTLLLAGVASASTARTLVQAGVLIDGVGATRQEVTIVVDEGRIVESVIIGDENRGAEFELVMHGADYFAAAGLAPDSHFKTVVLRFVMDDDARRYHLPVMLSPHSYSTWWSG